MKNLAMSCTVWPVAFNANSRALLSNCRQENFADKQSNFGAHACANAELKLLAKLHELSLVLDSLSLELHLQKQANAMSFRISKACKNKMPVHYLIKQQTKQVDSNCFYTTYQLKKIFKNPDIFFFIFFSIFTT